MTKPPSLQDVARTAKLSPATVSRYLNGSLTLPQETANRIDTAISALNYRPNPHARSLSRGRSDTIGLVIPDIGNPFFAKLAAAVENHADQAGLGLMLCSTANRQQRELDYIERLRRNHIDGLLFATNHLDDNQALASAINASQNIVVIDEDVDGTDVPKVFADNLEGGRLAARHFLDCGHRHVAYVGGPRKNMTARERAVGFAAEINAAGATLEAELFGEYTMDHGRRALALLLEKHPKTTAIFIGSEQIMYGMVGLAKTLRLRLGEHMSVITYDDVGQIALFDPPISAIRQPIDEIGRMGLELLRKRMDGDLSVPEVNLPVTLIDRGSVKRLF